MHLKSVFALHFSQLSKKKKTHFLFNSSTNTIHYSQTPKLTLQAHKVQQMRSYKVDKVLQIGTQKYSKQHSQIITKSSLKNLNIFLVGNQWQLKQKCIFSELKYCSIVKQLIKRIIEHTEKFYVSLETDQAKPFKQIINSYADFIAVLHQSKLESSKFLRICFEYSIDNVVYSTNVVKVPDNLKDVSEIFRLKESNDLVMKVCAKQKNNLFYLCLDKQSEESQEYLVMMGFMGSSKSVCENRNEGQKRVSRSSSRLRTESSNSVAKKKDRHRQKQEERQRYEQKQKDRERISEILSRKENASNKQQIRSKVTQKILIEKNRKIDQLTKILSTRDIEIQELKAKLSVCESQRALFSSQIQKGKESMENTTSKHNNLITQLQRQLKAQSEQSFERYKQYEDRIEQLKVQVNQLKKLDKLTLQKFEEISKQKFTQYGKQILELKESNKSALDQKQYFQRQIRTLTSKFQNSEKQNSTLKDQIKSKELELAKVNQKYAELSNKLKNLIVVD